jgi:hypothetical protein
MGRFEAEELRRRESEWTAFADRHGFTVDRHGHGAQLGARGKFDGFDVAFEERMTQLPISFEDNMRIGRVELVLRNACPQDVQLVVCDTTYYAACTEQKRVEFSERAYARMLRSFRKAGANDVPEKIAATALSLPHRFRPIPMVSRPDPTERGFVTLVQPEHWVWNADSLRRLHALPERVIMSLLDGFFRIQANLTRPLDPWLVDLCALARVVVSQRDAQNA